jgi:hypothetical protein
MPCQSIGQPVAGPQLACAGSAASHPPRGVASVLRGERRPFRRPSGGSPRGNERAGRGQRPHAATEPGTGPQPPCAQARERSEDSQRSPMHWRAGGGPGAERSEGGGPHAGRGRRGADGEADAARRLPPDARTTHPPSPATSGARRGPPRSGPSEEETPRTGGHGGEAGRSGGREETGATHRTRRRGGRPTPPRRAARLPASRRGECGTQTPPGPRAAART